MLSGIDSSARIPVVDETSSSSSMSPSSSCLDPSSLGPTPSSHNWRLSITVGSPGVRVRMRNKCFRSVSMRLRTYPMSLRIGSQTRCWYGSRSALDFRRCAHTLIMMTGYVLGLALCHHLQRFRGSLVTHRARHHRSHAACILW